MDPEQNVLHLNASVVLDNLQLINCSYNCLPFSCVVYRATGLFDFLVAHFSTFLLKVCSAFKVGQIGADGAVHIVIKDLQIIYTSLIILNKPSQELKFNISRILCQVCQVRGLGLGTLNNEYV